MHECNGEWWIVQWKRRISKETKYWIHSFYLWIKIELLVFFLLLFSRSPINRCLKNNKKNHIVLVLKKKLFHRPYWIIERWRKKKIQQSIWKKEYLPFQSSIYCIRIVSLTELHTMRDGAYKQCFFIRSTTM